MDLRARRTWRRTTSSSRAWRRRAPPTTPTGGSLVTAANVEKIPGLNTLGVSMSRVDIAPGGLNPPHTHPRATEIVFVLEGNKLIAKTISAGDVFVSPRGLVHLQKNNGNRAASAIAAFNSQLPGTQSIALTLFTATPPVPDNVLTKRPSRSAPRRPRRSNPA